MTSTASCSFILQLHLAKDPEAGDLIQGTGGFRKVRWADRRRGKGKARRSQGHLLLLRAGPSDLVPDDVRQGRGGGPDLEGEAGPEGGDRGREAAASAAATLEEDIVDGE